ncbi:MAG: hypothetical protein ACOZIN_11235 [Myxococcota bacterium]
MPRWLFAAVGVLSACGGPSVSASDITCDVLRQDAAGTWYIVNVAARFSGPEGATLATAMSRCGQLSSNFWSTTCQEWASDGSSGCTRSKDNPEVGSLEAKVSNVLASPGQTLTCEATFTLTVAGKTPTAPREKLAEEKKAFSCR